jgi:hypothetical protein
VSGLLPRELYVICFGDDSSSLQGIKPLFFLLILRPKEALRGISMDSAEPAESIDDRMV